jgi:hypothetical protein
MTTMRMSEQLVLAAMMCCEYYFSCRVRALISVGPETYDECDGPLCAVYRYQIILFEFAFVCCFGSAVE